MPSAARRVERDVGVLDVAKLEHAVHEVDRAPVRGVALAAILVAWSHPKSPSASPRRMKTRRIAKARVGHWRTNPGLVALFPGVFDFARRP